MKTRLLTIIKTIMFISLIGFIYYIIIMCTPFSLKCPIRKFIGFYCPCCGITRMALKLIQLDFYGAFRENMCLFSMAPFFIIFAIRKAIIYIKYGEKKLTKYENVFIYASAIILFIFGILRNIPYFSYFAPL